MSEKEQLLTAFRQRTANKETALTLLPRVHQPQRIRDVGYSNRTLLHWAGWNGWLDVVQVLLTEYHFDPLAEDDDGETVLHKACYFGYTEIARYLITRWNMDPLNENKYGRGSLYLSKATSRHDTAQYLESVVGKDYYI